MLVESFVFFFFSTCRLPPWLRPPFCPTCFLGEPLGTNQGQVDVSGLFFVLYDPGFEVFFFSWQEVSLSPYPFPPFLFFLRGSYPFFFVDLTLRV